MSESLKADSGWRDELWLRYKRHSDEHYEGHITYHHEDVSEEPSHLDYQGDRIGWVRLVVEQIRKRASARIIFLLPAPVAGDKEYRYVLSSRTVERIVSGELTAADMLL